MKPRKTMKIARKAAVADNDAPLVSFLAVMIFICLATVYFRDLIMP